MSPSATSASTWIVSSFDVSQEVVPNAITPDEAAQRRDKGNLSIRSHVKNPSRRVFPAVRISEEVADGKYIRVDCAFSDSLEARLFDEDIHCVLTDSLGDVQLLKVWRRLHRVTEGGCGRPRR